MKRIPQTSIPVVLTVLLTSASGLAQGTLIPPASAFTNNQPAATMKTLDQLEPRRPILKLPYTITEPGAYYLTGSLEGTNGIVIDVGDVQLDLKGFSLQGLTNSGHGIAITNMFEELHNVAIFNGAIVEWGGRGMDLGRLFDAEIRDVKLYANQGGGMVVGNHMLVQNCAVIECGGTGISVGDACTVTKCQAMDNKGDGIRTGIGCRITECLSASNEGDGIVAGLYSTVAECLVGRNWTNGISVSNSCLVVNNNCAENGVTNDPGAGVRIEGRGSRIRDNNLNGNYHGIMLLSGGNRIEGNNMIDNHVGIEDLNAGNLIIRNSVGGSSDTNYNLSTNCQYGAILKTMGSGFTNSNPWANFELPPEP